MTDKLTCDVCHKNEAAGVASSPLGPMSFAYCAECIRQNAEPTLMFCNLYFTCDYDLDKLLPEAREFKTFVQGEYISLDTWVARHGEGFRKHMEDFDG